MWLLADGAVQRDSGREERTAFRCAAKDFRGHIHADKPRAIKLPGVRVVSSILWMKKDSTICGSALEEGDVDPMVGA